MKLLTAIVRDEYALDVSTKLNAADLQCTRIASTGGFWRKGYVTMLIGVEENEIDKALAIIDDNAGPEIDPNLAPSSHPPHRATIFVLDVDQFARY